MMSYYLLLGIIALASAAVSQRLKSKFRTYEKRALPMECQVKKLPKKCFQTIRFTMLKSFLLQGG